MNQQQPIDPGTLRQFINDWREGMSKFPGENYSGEIMDGLEYEFLTPKPKTLADLVEEGHALAEYQWVQAEHRDERCIIVRMDGQPSQLTVSLLTATGSTIWVSTDEVIPLPDLPRLGWPASEPGEETPTPEVHPKVLLTDEDYRNAPYGTICAEDGRLPIYTNTWAWHTTPDGRTYDHSAAAGTPRRVLRWGLGEQA